MKTTTPLSHDTPQPKKTYQVNKDVAKKLAILLLILTFLGVVIIRMISHGTLGFNLQTAEVSGQVFQTSSTGPTPLEAVEVSIMSNGKRFKSQTDQNGFYTLLIETDFPDKEEFVNRRIVARYDQYETVGKNIQIPRKKSPVLEEVNITIGRLGYSAEEKHELDSQIADQHQFAKQQIDAIKTELDSLDKNDFNPVDLIEFQKLLDLYEKNTFRLKQDSLLFSQDLISIARMRESLVNIASMQDSLIQKKGELLFFNQP